MAYQNIPPSGTQSVQDFAQSLAVSALGVSADQLFFFFHPTYCDGGDEQAEIVAVGAGTRAAALQASALSSGGNGAAIITTDYGALAPTMIPTGATKKFWIGGYFATPAAGAAAQHSGVGVIDPAGAELAIIGMRGSSSTTNFVAWADTGGTFIDSGIALDTTKRLHEFYRDGSTGYYKINRALVGTANIRPSANCNPCAAARSGAAVITCTVGWWAGAAVRE